MASGFESGSMSANRLNQADMPWFPLLGAIKKHTHVSESQVLEITLLYHFHYFKVDAPFE